MPSDIVNFKGIEWSDTVYGQKAWIAGNLKNGEPTKVYGPHFVEDIEKHFLKSSSNGKIFYDDWGNLFVPKKKTVKVRTIITTTIEVDSILTEDEILDEWYGDFFLEDTEIDDVSMIPEEG